MLLTHFGRLSGGRGRIKSNLSNTSKEETEMILDCKSVQELCAKYNGAFVLLHYMHRCLIRS